MDFIKSHKSLCYSHLFITAIFFAFGVFFVPWLMNKIKDIKTKTQLKDTIKKLLLFSVLVMVPLYFIKIYLQSIIFPRWNCYVRSKLVKLYLNKNKIEYNDSNVSADIMNLYEIADQTSYIVEWFVTTFIPMAICVICINIYVLFISPVIGCILGIASLFLFYYLVSKVDSIVTIYKNHYTLKNTMVKQLDNIYTNLFNIYLNNQIEPTIEKNNKVEQEYEIGKNAYSYHLLKFATILRFSSIIFIILGILYLYIHSDEILAENFYSISTLLIFYFTRVDSLTESIPHNISKFVNLTQNEHLYRLKEQTYEPITTIEGDISFKNVSFGYSDEPIIQDLSFDIKKGTVVGILGETGTGKSTIMKLILKFYNPTSGSILLDNQDVQKIHPDTIRSHLYYINQRTMLFHDTLLNNLRYGTTIPEEDVLSFLQKYQLDSVFKQLGEDWLYKKIETHGANISLGMQKIIFLVRGILHNKPVYLIDEPFTSIDSNTRKKVLNLLTQETKGKTVVIITHDIEGLGDLFDSTITLKKHTSKS
jgi:ABC-type multidrug transport system fused ATPase/permease subunit